MRVRSYVTQKEHASFLVHYACVVWSQKCLTVPCFLLHRPGISIRTVQATEQVSLRTFFVNILPCDESLCVCLVLQICETLLMWVKKVSDYVIANSGAKGEKRQGLSLARVYQRSSLSMLFFGFRLDSKHAVMSPSRHHLLRTLPVNFSRSFFSTCTAGYQLQLVLKRLPWEEGGWEGEDG